MKTKFFLSILALGLIVSAFGQKPTLELTFTAIDSASYFQLDSIKVMNRTQGGDTVLYWPDTVLILDYQVGITENNNRGENLQVFQNYPNPVKDQTTIILYVPEKDKVGVMISDILGRKVIKTEKVLDRGYHSFRFAPGGGEIFFFTAYWKATSSSIKILHAATSTDRSGFLEYLGSYSTEPHLKSVNNVQSFEFNLGDKLLYIGYANGLQSGMLDAPETSEDYTFQFATNITCPGTPIVTYEGQVYNTIQIFSQCWLKENLNVGTMIPGEQWMTDNGVIEKYCYGNDTDNCATYGGLYQWKEMMQYTTTQGVQGICPPGWHIPKDEEWKVLEGVVDSLYGVGDPEWDQTAVYRGFDAGKNLKSTYGWNKNSNGTDLFGFSALPGGYRRGDGGFYDMGYSENFWSSTVGSSLTAWGRGLHYYSDAVYRIVYSNYFGFSVRCVRDMEPILDFIELTFTAIDSAANVQFDSLKVMNHTQGGDTTLFWPDTILVLKYEIEPNPQKFSRLNRGIDFSPGDELLYIAYIDTLESGMLDSPETSETYTFQFAYNIPCPGIPTVTYEGQVYNTVQIFSQCWLKENLNVGTMVPGNQNMTDDGVIEKYCYDNNEANCDVYGGLYQWNEMMQYTATQGVQGICPQGWHIPTDDEWKILEGVVDSLYGVGDPEWDGWNLRGFDAGKRLKSKNSWVGSGNGINSHGFSALPGGYRYLIGHFGSIGGYAGIWSSTEYSGYGRWLRVLGYDYEGVYRYDYGMLFGFSARCLKD